MKTRLLYSCLLIILCAGFFSLGWHLHQPPVTSNDLTPDGPYFTEATPYLHIVYGYVGEANTCPPTNTSDDYVCIYKLSHTALEEADALARKLIETSPEKNAPQHEGYYDELHTNVRAAQGARDVYFDAICGLDELFIYGGSGMGLEREACRYYYANQYLKVLQKLEMDTDTQRKDN